jgi:hypothetical protein
MVYAKAKIYKGEANGKEIGKSKKACGLHP